MPNKNTISFFGPAYYEIKIRGQLHESILENFNITQYIEKKNDEGYYISSFVIHIIDQAALSGLINNLFNLKLSINSIRKIDRPKTKNHSKANNKV
ncbi:MAG: hypothetical protein QNK30_05025 [Bacteroidales bacterium]|nr:hypothetical protein [Bacteroidales bacterium]